ncbi:ABC transporter permease subunit [Flexivirga caeni]|uniref:ABC transporter permease n=1 Tax=Flexivirga caeni TaxID=2294115 RepID=A0A3M9MFN5_9MICO|nr:ABC transporter permease subunit [Flexivirga caeni]RNI24370.1 ABC transporter permease [Flexivirga caeni]
MSERLEAGTASAIPFGRLVALELRKLTDTRAGRVLILVAIGLVVAVGLIGVFSGKPSQDKNLRDFLALGSLPLQLMLPLLGVLAVTAEWSQRTGLVTFTLEPRRSRIAFAKWVAALALGAAGVVIALVVAFGFTGLTDALRSSNPSWHLSWQVVLGTVVGQLLYMSIGVAFGMLIQNTPGAIVAFLILPTLWSILGSFSWSENIAQWADTNRTLSPLYNATMHGDDWAKLVVSLLIWLALPMIAGIWRMTHSEVKSA